VVHDKLRLLLICEFVKRARFMTVESIVSRCHHRKPLDRVLPPPLDLAHQQLPVLSWHLSEELGMEQVLEIGEAFYFSVVKGWKE
jgi:hypothetical protein